MHKHFFKFIFISIIIVGCAVIPVEAPQSQINKLSFLLESLDSHIPQSESIELSRDIFQKTKQLTKDFELTSPPIWHNFLVNVGVRKKGLCFDWSDALYYHLKEKHYAHFSFHLVGANIGEYFLEHNALVVVANGGKVEKGVVIDPWRDSGKLYFSKVKEDKKYVWSHRIDRGCE